jgi:NAD(P)-dependent dehydrogenase (short-subunit alcohol dehydrogenase family)
MCLMIIYKIFLQVKEVWGSIDVLVNNAAYVAPMHKVGTFHKGTLHKVPYFAQGTLQPKHKL